MSGEYYFVGTKLLNGVNYVPLAIKKGIKLIDDGFEYLKNTPDSSKAITWAVVEQNNVVVAICNTHFWWKRTVVDEIAAFDPSEDRHCKLRMENAEQLTSLMKKLQDKYSCTVFAFGDMNATVQEGIFDIYRQNKIKNLFDIADQRDEVCTIHGDPVADSNGIFHGARATKEYILSFLRELALPCEKIIEGNLASIDHIIALGDGFEITKYRVVEDQKALDATDHSPVCVDIRFVL